MIEIHAMLATVAGISLFVGFVFTNTPLMLIGIVAGMAMLLVPRS